MLGEEVSICPEYLGICRNHCRTACHEPSSSGRFLNSIEKKGLVDLKHIPSQVNELDPELVVLHSMTEPFVVATDQLPVGLSIKTRAEDDVIYG